MKFRKLLHKYIKAKQEVEHLKLLMCDILEDKGFVKHYSKGEVTWDAPLINIGIPTVQLFEAMVNDKDIGELLNNETN